MEFSCLGKLHDNLNFDFAKKRENFAFEVSFHLAFCLWIFAVFDGIDDYSYV